MIRENYGKKKCDKFKLKYIHRWIKNLKSSKYKRNNSMLMHQRRIKHHIKPFTMNIKILAFKNLFLKTIRIVLVLLLMIDIGICEYENTWNFYYEQPCCSSSNIHHLRHHKGNCKLIKKRYCARYICIFFV